MQAEEPAKVREPIDFAQLCDVHDDFRLRMAKVSDGFCPYCDEPLERGHQGFTPYNSRIDPLDVLTSFVTTRNEVEGARCHCCESVYATLEDGPFGPGYSSSGGTMCEHIRQLITTGMRGVD